MAGAGGNDCHTYRIACRGRRGLSTRWFAGQLSNKTIDSEFVSPAESGRTSGATSSDHQSWTRQTLPKAVLA